MGTGPPGACSCTRVQSQSGGLVPRWCLCCVSLWDSAWPRCQMRAPRGDHVIIFPMSTTIYPHLLCTRPWRHKCEPAQLCPGSGTGLRRQAHRSGSRAQEGRRLPEEGGQGGRLPLRLGEGTAPSYFHRRSVWGAGTLLRLEVRVCSRHASISLDRCSPPMSCKVFTSTSRPFSPPTRPTALWL